MFRAGTGPQHYLFLERLNRMTTEKKLHDMATNRPSGLRAVSAE